MICSSAFWKQKCENLNNVSLTFFKFQSRVRTGHGKPGKSWNFITSFSRPGKSWNLGVGHGKSWKMMFVKKYKI